MVMVYRDITEAGALPTSVNRLTEAVILKRPPPLMLINRGGYPKMPASFIALTEAVSITWPPQIKVLWWRVVATCPPPLMFSYLKKASAV
jgi:hypothetical protein